MIKVEFKNASVVDSGWGLDVNGDSLRDILSQCVGVKDTKGDRVDNATFRFNNCDITVIIDPHPSTATISEGDVTIPIEEYLNKKEEQAKDEHDEETPETDPEE